MLLSPIPRVEDRQAEYLPDQMYNEDQYQSFWNGLGFPKTFRTFTGEQVTVLHGGYRNTNAGPDFKDAILFTGESVIRGDVELHLKLSGWWQHNHHTDQRYSNVVLHVVDGSLSTELYTQIAHNYTPRYTVAIRLPVSFKKNDQHYRCYRSRLHSNPEYDLEIAGWRRIMSKTSRFANQLARVTSPEQLWLGKTLRVLGYTPNADIMESVANKITFSQLNLLTERWNSREQFDFLLGFTGFQIDPKTGNTPWNDLREFLQLEGFSKHNWAPLQSRPANHPVLRLWMFLRQFQHWHDLFSQWNPAQKPEQVLDALVGAEVIPSEYQVQFGMQHARLGRARAIELLTNAWLPLWILTNPDSFTTDRLYHWAKMLPPIPTYRRTRKFIRKSYFTKYLNPEQLPPLVLQGLLWLDQHYCSKQMCLTCPVLESQ